MNRYDALFIATTDTVPGIGAPVSVANQKLINELKHSPVTKRLVVMVDSIATAREYYATQGFDEKAEALAKKYWPGATTLVCSESLALRIPDLAPLQALIKKIGPIHMTSANLSGQKPLSLADAKRVFAMIEHVYDFGEGSGKPSQIIDVHENKTLRD